MVYEESLVRNHDLDNIRERLGARKVNEMIDQVFAAVGPVCVYDSKILLQYCLGRLRGRHVGELTLEEANLLMAEHSGRLDLSNTDIKALPDGLEVEDCLDLSGSTVQSLPDALVVGNCLDLHHSDIESLPRGLRVGGWLYLHNTRIASIPADLLAGEGINLANTSVTALPEGLAVGTNLYLHNTPIASLPSGLVVGGDLDLMDTHITSLPDDLLIGGNIFMLGTGTTSRRVKRLREGDYVPSRYIFADGYLVHVKGEERLDGYTFYVGKIPGKNVITDGKRYARCRSVHDGIEALALKAALERGVDWYKGLSLDTEMSADDANVMYWAITRTYRREIVPEGRYTVREILDIAKGQLGYRMFAEFFGQ